MVICRLPHCGRVHQYDKRMHSHADDWHGECLFLERHDDKRLRLHVSADNNVLARSDSPNVKLGLHFLHVDSWLERHCCGSYRDAGKRHWPHVIKHCIFINRKRNIEFFFFRHFFFDTVYHAALR